VIHPAQYHRRSLTDADAIYDDTAMGNDVPRNVRIVTQKDPRALPAMYLRRHRALPSPKDGATGAARRSDQDQCGLCANFADGTVLAAVSGMRHAHQPTTFVSGSYSRCRCPTNRLYKRTAKRMGMRPLIRCTMIIAGRTIKRFLDLAICLCALPLALPICLVAMVAIWCETPASPLFVQWRVGRNQRPFRLLKLRTMAPHSGDLPSHQMDPRRITRIGAFLRRSKLDELPQLFNVIVGSMSLVGPRPCLQSQHELIAEREKRGLFHFLPGVTGPAQLLGIDMSDPLLLARTEAGYFQQVTPLRDLMLISRTATGAGRGDAVLKPR